MSYYLELDDFELEYLKIRLQLRKLMQEAWDNQGLMPVSKWIYYFVCSIRVSVIQTYRGMSPSDIVFPTVESAENAILLIGEDRLKKYYFCVEGTEVAEDEQEI